MAVTSIRITFGPSRRRKPKAGDRRTTKAHGLQIRVWLRAPCGAMRVSNGRPCFDWVKPADLAPEDRHYLTTDERKEPWATP